MMKATAKDLRFNSKGLLDTVNRGEEIVITFRGKPCAKLVPYTENNEETIKNRLEVYHSETAPLIEYYGESVLAVEGEKAPDEVFSDILANLE